MVVDIRTWVKNVVNQPPSVAPNDIIVPLSTPTMSAKAVLICRPNSHPFQERTLILDQPVKVGRSVARAGPSPTNAIFDCKVLSRHHALLWYENGKFYLQDTKSSNGTFVNNNRLSAAGVESVPHVVCSGDVVQFGVEVVENNRKVTHGCIVATLKLYLHDGKEAKATHSLAGGASFGTVPLDELYKLNQYLQDALQREHLLETKLNTLHNLVEQAREATNSSWQAFIGEDRLLSRVETLECKLMSYSKNYSEDKMREELLKLQEDKNSYQISAKESLRKLHQERLDAIAKLTALQQTLASSEEEKNLCNKQRTKAQEDLQELAQKYSTNQQQEAELRSQLATAEERERETDQRIQELLDKVDSQKDSLVELHKQLEKCQHDILILRLVITELNKCTENNCPLELKYKVEKIINEGLIDMKHLPKTDEQSIDQLKLDQVDNHKENNVPVLNETESNKFKECRETLHAKEMEDILLKLQESLQDGTEENDNKKQDLEKLKQQIVRLAEKSSTESQHEPQEKLVNESLDNSQYVKRDEEIYELNQKLRDAQNEILEKTTTISKMTEEVEHLLESSGIVNVKMNLLEDYLEEEKRRSQSLKEEIDSLKHELNVSQQMLSSSNMEEQLLHNKVEFLTAEMNRRPTVESYEEVCMKCGNLEKLLARMRERCGAKEIYLDDSGSSPSSLMAEIDNTKLTELEEELVLMKERYAECNLEKIQLNKNLEQLRQQHDALANSSYNAMFLYIAPLLLIIAYLLFKSWFS